MITNSEKAEPKFPRNYNALEAAILETELGRWFLAEYRRRNCPVDTKALLLAIKNLEKRISTLGAPLASQPAARKISGHISLTDTTANRTTIPLRVSAINQNNRCKIASTSHTNEAILKGQRSPGAALASAILAAKDVVREPSKLGKFSAENLKYFAKDEELFAPLNNGAINTFAQPSSRLSPTATSASSLTSHALKGKPASTRIKIVRTSSARPHNPLTDDEPMTKLAGT